MIVALLFPVAELAAARANPRGGRGSNLIDTFDADVLTGVQLLVDRTSARDGYGVDLLRSALHQLEAGRNPNHPYLLSLSLIPNPYPLSLSLIHISYP
jgi:hypothetical protein